MHVCVCERDREREREREKRERERSRERVSREGWEMLHLNSIKSQSTFKMYFVQTAVAVFGKSIPFHAYSLEKTRACAHGI